MMNKLLELQEHAYNLSKTINQLGNSQNDAWLLASDWLHLGSSIDSIQVITESYDDTIMFCGPAIEYENEKSKVLEKFTRELTIFNFFWGALETILKIIDPPKVPNELKKRRNIIDDCVYFLKENYPIINLPESYCRTLRILKRIVSKDQQYKDLNINQLLNNSYSDYSGQALLIIRLIRNDFAHGSYSFPEPDDWSYNNFTASDSIKKINLSSRLILITIQMCLISLFKERDIDIVEWRTGNYVNLIEKVYTLHLKNSSKINFGLFYKN